MTSQVPRLNLGWCPNGEPNLKFDNGGKDSLLVPGFGHPVPIELPCEDRFAHGFNDWAQDRLTAREMAMLGLMNSITDRPRWYVEINDPSQVAIWTEEALRTHLIRAAAWDWCLKELRDKSEFYTEKRFTLVLDSSSRICKSDDLVPAALLEKIASEVESLSTNDAPHLVSPDCFPLVYGQTRALVSGGRVGRMKAADLVGQGERSHEQIWKCRNQTFVNCDGSLRRAGGTRRGRGNGRGNYGGREERCGRCGSSGRSPERSWERRGGRFSANFQWLPCEVELRPVSSKSGSSIRAASYINNLHPRHHASLYDSIEKCIELSIETWNEVLVYWGRGRTPERIRTCGVQWTSLPESLACLKNRTTTVGSAQDPPSSETEKLLDQFLLQPDNPRVPAPSRRYPAVGRDWRDHFSPAKAIEAKYHRVKEWFHPEPGTTFTYEEWARGENNRAILPECGPELPEVVDRSSRRNRPFYTVSIENDFADQGLQVVVEIGEVELTPAEPSRSSTDWQLTGLANDHIVATTVIYFSSENVTPESGSISFRVEAQLDPQMHIYGTGTGSNPFHPLEPLADVYGCASHLDLTGEDAENAPGGPALQVLGTVAAPDGRLITFPNVMQHRIEAFQLVDLSRSGRRKWLKLHLVDPHYRVCSTRNVPPQQHDWWYEAGLGKLDWAAREMPAELVQEIESLVGEFPTTNKLANEVRGDILEERKRKFEIVSRNVPPYNFGDWAAYGSTAGEDAR